MTGQPLNLDFFIWCYAIFMTVMVGYGILEVYFMNKGHRRQW